MWPKTWWKKVNKPDVASRIKKLSCFIKWYKKCTHQENTCFLTITSMLAFLLYNLTKKNYLIHKKLDWESQTEAVQEIQKSILLSSSQPINNKTV